MHIRSLAMIAAAFEAKHPSAPQSGTVDLSASAGTVDTIEAAAVRGFASVSGKLMWIRATKNFYVSGDIVPVNSFVQLPELDAKRQIYLGKAEEASEAEVAAAQAADTKAKK